MIVGRKENQIGLKLGHDSREKKNQIGFKLGYDSREKRKSDRAQARS